MLACFFFHWGSVVRVESSNYIGLEAAAAAEAFNKLALNTQIENVKAKRVQLAH